MLKEKAFIQSFKLITKQVLDVFCSKNCFLYMFCGYRLTRIIDSLVNYFMKRFWLNSDSYEMFIVAAREPAVTTGRF